jgi:hypothetical protein
MMTDDNETEYTAAHSNHVQYSVIVPDDITHFDLTVHFQHFLNGCGYVVHVDDVD